MFVLLAAIFALQILQGLDAYVIVEHNGYDNLWRPSPLTPGYYYYYHPYSWGYPHSDSRELMEIRGNQKLMFDVLKCLVEQNIKETCKKMLMEGIMLPITPTKEPGLVIAPAPPAVPETEPEKTAPLDPVPMEPLVVGPAPMAKQDAVLPENVESVPTS